MPYSFRARAEIWNVNESISDTSQWALVMSQNKLNGGPGKTVIVLWISSKSRGDLPFDIVIESHESGLDRTAYIRCDEIEAIAKADLVSQAGVISQAKMRQVEECLRVILGLPPFRPIWLPGGV